MKAAIYTQYYTASHLRVALCLILSGCGTRAQDGSGPPEYDTTWKALITGTLCVPEVHLKPKGVGTGGTITCEKTSGGARHFRFPPGMFDIDEQVPVPASTAIEGNASPNDPVNRTKKPDPPTQTYFVATKGVTDANVPYCGTNNNLQPGDAQKLRIGFLLHSNTIVKNVNFQGKDTVRPLDNGNLCGGGAFETPGCVSPGFGDGPGLNWLNKRSNCYDHTGKMNQLVTGDGKGVENVTIDNVRVNDLLLPSEPSEYEAGMGSQLAVWVAMTRDGSATKNVTVTNLVSMLTRADGINLHGNVQGSVVEDSHIENTGDDIYAFWGAYAQNPTGNIFFRNNVGKNAGVTRAYMYGVCVAVYGATQVTITGMKCYDRGRNTWNPGQVPTGNGACQHGPYCNSCLAYVHDHWFGAVYPDGNTINMYNNEYMYMDQPTTAIPSTDRPHIRKDAGSNAHIINSSALIFL
eukprot:gnl/MRDRNA2_/MRDRNA2_125286_c0_seq1.p1 gnl/MRDRNA2_/MRDRNA2_125286_c0~~gnl/MRDRNA2_/MRDRNA2_125286_c0_seq1.p1  ORF type:complete len:463 (+),score=59.37 gnl/MRDRNA2_/MRDRNA2_125286_c0_seq1:91-1479(+)